ncbi:MAG: hypothetical protein NTW60_00505 [Candidatus Wolfebacteria bacterium]|nr:hypothetical protein [Candidatus Wolfebacteria bacterium]
MKKLFLLDANSLIHRAYHALPPFTDVEGNPTGALYGLSTILLKIVKDESPDYIAAFFDRPEATFRKKIFNDYKIHRPKAPDQLIAQIISSHNLFENFGMKIFESPGFEADDLIGTAVEKFKNEPGLGITIFTGDMDSLQLIDNGHIQVKALKTGVSQVAIYDEAAVKERYGVPPEDLPDYKGLVGDQSDNIPGVPGIGPKTASQIIQKYKTLENFFKDGKEDKSYAKIKEMKEQALLSRDLSTIKRDSPLEIKDISEISYPGLPLEKILEYFEKRGFKSLINRLSPNAEEISPKPKTKKPKEEKKTPSQKQTLF